VSGLGTSLGVFIGLTLVLMGGAAILSGRAIAENWKPAWHAVAAAVGLAIADRFLTYALFGGELLNLPGFLVHFAVLAGLALLAWRIARVNRLCRQYPWRYARSSIVNYEELS
jgi:hypothetical protein